MSETVTHGAARASGERRPDERRVGALMLVSATVVAICWVNLSPVSYDTFWSTPLTVGAGDLHLDLTLQSAVNDALMAVFFFFVGLEVRREFAIGELTDRRRALTPVAAAIAGLVVPTVIFMLFVGGSGHENAWGVVISTDTAFLAGLLALIGPARPGRLRTFLLTLAVVDDIGALLVIAIVYTRGFRPLPLLVAAAGLIGIAQVRRLPAYSAPLYATLSVAVWLGFLGSGVHPTLAGVAIAMAVPVYRTRRADVEGVLGLVHAFRQSPNTTYARAAVTGLRDAISINERLQQVFAPYVGYVILPLFALANAGVRLSGPILVAAVGSPLTWGIVAGLVVGKFIGVFGSSVLLRALRLGDFGRGLTMDRLAGGAALSGVGFTIALFIIPLALSDQVAQNQARVGVLVASILATALSAVIFQVSAVARPRTDAGRVLIRPVDADRDHIAGPADASLTIVEYGDFECEFCLRASGSIDEVRQVLGDAMRYVWRHAPRTRIHPRAFAAATASEAAARQGAFFPFLRSIFDDPRTDRLADLPGRAADLGLDTARFDADRVSSGVAARVRQDVRDADAMDITDVPTLFVNGRRHVGPFDADTLIQALLGEPPVPPPAGSRHVVDLTLSDHDPKE